MKPRMATWIAASALGLAAPTWAQQSSSPGESRPWDQETPQRQGAGPSPTINPDVVRQTQQALRDAGYHSGEADGTFDEDVHKALTDFQRAQGMAPTGKLDEQTLNALGVRAESGDHAGAGLQSPGGGADTQNTTSGYGSGQP